MPIFKILIGLLILLSLWILLPPGHNLCCRDYYKLCDHDCVMHGSDFGTSYDDPCSDNVSFMMVHRVDGLRPSEYTAKYGSMGKLPLLHSSTSIAMHHPIFPSVSKECCDKKASECITFNLDNENSIASADLHIRVEQSKTSTLPDIPIAINEDLIKATWKRDNFGSFTKTLTKGTIECSDAVECKDAGAISTVDNITFKTRFSKLKKDHYTLITYRFDIKYLNNITDTINVTFALQDYYNLIPDNYPAPIYVQGDSKQLADILFIPANNHGGSAIDLDPAVLSTFRQSCKDIISDVVFSDPTMRFWRNQFNFWINKQTGEAKDYNRCPDECCHELPSDIADFAELKALLHQADQRDFTDNCARTFSAEMEPERTAFLHELGHAAFYLRDEYSGGWNGQDTLNLPNNWFNMRSAKGDAPFRHKTEEDAKRIN